jgi:hypothetical protein
MISEMQRAIKSPFDRVELPPPLFGELIMPAHLWHLGPGHAELVAAIVSDHPKPPTASKARLAAIKGCRTSRSR